MRLETSRRPYDKSWLLRIDLWIRRLSWYILIGLPLGIVVGIMDTLKFFNYIQPFLEMGEKWLAWEFLVKPFVDARLAFAALFFFLLLRGTSKIIRYLIALNDNFHRKYVGN